MNDSNMELGQELIDQLMRAEAAGLRPQLADALILISRYRVLTRERADALGIDLAMAKVLQNRGMVQIDNDPKQGWWVAITDKGDRVLYEDPSDTR